MTEDLWQGLEAGEQGRFRAIEKADEDTEGDEEHLEVEEDEGAKPARENVAPMPKPEPRRDPESPLEVFTVNSPSLPVYLGPPKATIPNDAASSVLVRTILVTWAGANCIRLGLCSWPTLKSST